jgi:hypothetical protein
MWRVWLTGNDGCDWLMNQFDGEEEARKYLVFINSLKPWATGWCDQSDDEIGFWGPRPPVSKTAPDGYWQVRVTDDAGSQWVRHQWAGKSNNVELANLARDTSKQYPAATWRFSPVSVEPGSKLPPGVL